MRKVYILLAVLLILKVRGQDYGLYLSGGLHLGFWKLALSGPDSRNASSGALAAGKIPYNIHIDKLFKTKEVVGIGYSFDGYSKNPLTSAHLSTVRQNIRLRYYKYHRDPEQRFATYSGFSIGLSHWKVNDKSSSDGPFANPWWPTAQFLFGFKVKINPAFFWQTEMAIGPPYAFQSSLGIKF